MNDCYAEMIRAIGLTIFGIVVVIAIATVIITAIKAEEEDD